MSKFVLEVVGVRQTFHHIRIAIRCAKICARAWDFPVVKTCESLGASANSSLLPNTLPNALNRLLNILPNILLNILLVILIFSYS